MSDRMQVPADERGTVRLFTVDLDAPRIAALRAADDEDESPGLRDTRCRQPWVPVRSIPTMWSSSMWATSPGWDCRAT